MAEDERTRSEYRHTFNAGDFTNTVDALITLDRADHEGLSELMLGAYRGSVDDEGETMVEARQAIDRYFELCLPEHSFVLVVDHEPVAMSLVLIVEDIHYIDPIAVTASHKGAGLGRRMVESSLASLAAAGVTEVGATITDGNEPSERLFASLGFTRVGSWG